MPNWVSVPEAFRWSILRCSENQSVWNTGEIALPIMGHHVHPRLSESLLSEAFSSCFHSCLIIQALEKNSPAYSVKAWNLTSKNTTRSDTFLINAMRGAIHCMARYKTPKTCRSTNVYCYRRTDNMSVPWFLCVSVEYGCFGRKPTCQLKDSREMKENKQFMFIMLLWIYSAHNQNHSYWLKKIFGNKTGDMNKNECDKYFSSDCWHNERGRKRESAYLHRCHKNIDSIISEIM